MLFEQAATNEITNYDKKKRKETMFFYHPLTSEIAFLLLSLFLKSFIKNSHKHKQNTFKVNENAQYKEMVFFNRVKYSFVFLSSV